MKIGDTVSVVDEDLSGVITSVKGNVVVFKDEYGFTHQYPKEKLVPKNAELYENIRIVKKPNLKRSFLKNIRKIIWFWTCIFIIWLKILMTMTALKDCSSKRKS